MKALTEEELARVLHSYRRCKTWENESLVRQEVYLSWSRYLLERLNITPKDLDMSLGNCTGCTDPRSEGTHQMGTIQHPLERKSP